MVLACTRKMQGLAKPAVLAVLSVWKLARTYVVFSVTSIVLNSFLQGVPMYSCNFSVQGPTNSPWGGPAVARYLAASLTAAGQQFCSSQSAAQSLSSLCGSSLQVTGLCAASLQSNSAPLSCTVPTPPKDWQMSVSFGIPAATCSSSSINMTADGVGSLVQYLSGFLPGYNVTLPAWATSPLTCSRVQVRCPCFMHVWCWS